MSNPRHLLKLDLTAKKFDVTETQSSLSEFTDIKAPITYRDNIKQIFEVSSPNNRENKFFEI